MGLSMRQKAKHVTFRICIQTLESFTLLVAQKPDQAPICPVCPESDRHCNPMSKICTKQTVSKQAI
jgi:hypothetical protein